MSMINICGGFESGSKTGGLGNLLTTVSVLKKSGTNTSVELVAASSVAASLTSGSPSITTVTDSLIVLVTPPTVEVMMIGRSKLPFWAEAWSTVNVTSPFSYFA